MALRAVLDQPQSACLGGLGESRQFGRLAVNMHREDCHRPARRRLLQCAREFAWRHRIGTGFHIDQHRQGAGPLDRCDRRDCGVRDGEDEVSRADPAGSQCDLDGICPAADADRVRNSDEIRKGHLEGLDLPAENIGVAFEDAGDGGVDRRPFREVASPRIRLRDGKGRSVDGHSCQM